MTTDEPYRWLEAIANRREYIRDQLRGATPVIAASRPEGVLLLGVGTGQSKVFELYDRHALAALGHPVDIEKIRQTLIETAHTEGFTRAPEDVTLRRLLNFSLGPALKNSFEQIFSAPLIVESVVAELGATPLEDTLARVNFDGTYRFETKGVVIAHTDLTDEAAATDWLRAHLGPDRSLGDAARLLLAVWQSLTTGKPFLAPALEETEKQSLAVDNKVVEMALLDRQQRGRSRYRSLTPAELS